MLDKLKQHWNLIAQTGAWVMGVVSGFVVSPQMGGPRYEKSIWNLTQFVVNILVGLMLVLTYKYTNRSHLKAWIAVTALALVLGVLAYFSYINQLGRCTCRYYSKTVLAGTQLRDPQKESNTPCEELLKTHTGDVEEIWTSSSINHCRLVLAVSYVSTVPLFAISLISVVQAGYVASRKRRR